MNLILIGTLILASHSPLVLLGAFAAMILLFRLTKRHQGALDFKPGLLVGGFLAGLTLLTADQGGWISPLLTTFSKASLYLGAITLTAFTDNAALTSLATQAPGLSSHAQYLIVAGAVVGGGLTLVANAPNPVGFSILKARFGKEGLSPITLFIYALLPTLIAGALLWKPS
jgi:Na+/H+ antiporter NhaD/arsenite permease-like protein